MKAVVDPLAKASTQDAGPNHALNPTNHRYAPVGWLTQRWTSQGQRRRVPRPVFSCATTTGSDFERNMKKRTTARASFCSLLTWTIARPLPFLRTSNIQRNVRSGYFQSQPQWEACRHESISFGFSDY